MVHSPGCFKLVVRQHITAAGHGEGTVRLQADRKQEEEEGLAFRIPSGRYSGNLPITQSMRLGDLDSQSSPRFRDDERYLLSPRGCCLRGPTLALVAMESSWLAGVLGAPLLQ